MPREVDEWIGAKDDTPSPPRVKIRVFERYGGVCQCGCGIKIAGKRWECDHALALINGGKNRESNLVPLLADHHKAKTRTDVATKAKTARMKAGHLGLNARRLSSILPGSKASRWRKKINGQVVPRDE